VLKLSANISLLYPELPFLDRIYAAARAGFRAVEVMYPYGYSAHEFARALRSSSLTLSVLNAPPGNYEDGERGLAAIPGREQEFRESLKYALEYASITGCSSIHVLTGNTPDGVDAASVEQTLRNNLNYAAKFFLQHRIALLLEPLSRQILPLYSLSRVEHASCWVRELRAAGFDNVGLQVDLYHTQMEQGNLEALIHRYFDEIKYVQIASVPGRHEPTVGEINYRYLLELLETLRFSGCIGCEYIPQASTNEGLSWAREWGLLPPDTIT